MPSKSKYGPGFHHVAVGASDFDKSLTFYTEGLGYTRVYGWGEGDSRAAMLDIGDGNYIELFAGHKPRAEFSEGPILHWAVRVEDCDAAYAQALSAGATSHMEPANVDIQGERVVPVRIAFVRGPDGELFEFFQNEEL